MIKTVPTSLSVKCPVLTIDAVRGRLTRHMERNSLGNSRERRMIWKNEIAKTASTTSSAVIYTISGCVKNGNANLNRGETTMPVIIKAMSKPEKCQYCPFLRWYTENGNLWCNATNKLMKQGWYRGIDIDVPDDCPIVSVPENCYSCKHSEDTYDSGFCDGCSTAHSSWEPIWEGE